MSRNKPEGYQSANVIHVEQEELRKLLTRTDKANPKAEDITALRKALREQPEFGRQIGDLARITQGKLIDQLSGTALTREGFLHRTEELRRELGYEEAPAAERLLIEQVVLCWLHFHKMQHSYGGLKRNSTLIVQADHWERLMNAAQRRYLRSIETLARVRKLSGRGPVQINIAEQQVNMAG